MIGICRFVRFGVERNTTKFRFRFFVHTIAPQSSTCEQKTERREKAEEVASFSRAHHSPAEQLRADDFHFSLTLLLCSAAGDSARLRVRLPTRKWN